MFHALEMIVLQYMPMFCFSRNETSKGTCAADDLIKISLTLRGRGIIRGISHSTHALTRFIPLETCLLKNEFTLLFLLFVSQIQSLAEESDLGNKTLILILLDELRVSSKSSRGRNPTDLGANIEAVGLLVQAQDNTVNLSDPNNPTYPTFDNTNKFAKVWFEDF